MPHNKLFPTKQIFYIGFKWTITSIEVIQLDSIIENQRYKMFQIFSEKHRQVQSHLTTNNRLFWIKIQSEH